MKLTRLLIPIVLGTTLTLLFVLGIAGAESPLGANTRYVSPTGTDAGACAVSTAPCLTVQYAVDMAGSGDRIHVAAGTYTGVLTRSAPAGYSGPSVVTQTLHLNKSLTVQGGYSADFSAQDPDVYITTLDAQGSGRVLFIAGAIAPAIKDLHLVNGDADGLGGHPLLSNNAGGGVYVITATATLDNLHVMSNTVPAGYGGGVILIHSPSTLSQSVIQGNVVGIFKGGGVYLYESDALVMDNLILQNDANNSGGLHAYQSSFILSNNVIQENNAFGSGAGIGIENSGYPFYQPILTGNLILSNTLAQVGPIGGSQGGGLHLFFSDPLMNGNVIQGNVGDYGGGVYADNSVPESTNDVVLGNQVWQAGSGVYLLGSQAVFTHTTLSSNFGAEGSGLYLKTSTDFGNVDSTAAITNAIVVSHSVGITASASNTATVNGVLWFGNSGGDTASAGSFVVSNAVTGDPAFDVDGYHLTASSMALDQGVNSGLAFDIDGDARPLDLLYDLGADEFSLFKLFLPLVQR